MLQRYRSLRSLLVGIAICAVSAALLSAMFASRPFYFSVPLFFVVVLVLLATRYGARVGIVGSPIAAVIFAYFLYPPHYSLRVSNESARSSLAWMLLAGITLSYLLAGPPHAPGDGK